MPHSINDWLRYFPKSKPRDVQTEAINFALDSFIDHNKKFVILELGVGCGKSAVAMTVAQYMEQNVRTVGPDGISDMTGTYILTTQKVLQKQYVDDFGPGVGHGKNLILSIKSSSNYVCEHYKEQSCAESKRTLTQLGKSVAGTEFHTTCRTKCPYTIDKQAFMLSPISITNFPYFLAETNYSKQLEPRALLVIDEAHNCESELGKFIEITFSEKFAKDALRCKVPALSKQEEVFSWVSGQYKSALSRHLRKLTKEIAERFTAGSIFSELSKQHEMLDKHICKVNRFIESYEPNNWVMNIVRPPAGSRRGLRKFEFKPVDVSKFGDAMLYSQAGRVLIMSATIIDKDVFCSSVGIDQSQVSYLNIPSPFPIENRMINYVPVGSMSMKNIDTTLPIMAKAVKMLLDQHPDDKGIIHCVSFKVAQYLMQHVGSGRLLTHTSENRDSVLTYHVATPKATVLLSPSMMEGVDLADDASRFQILCKVPFPYLGDEVIKRRMERSKTWYSYQTVKSIVQSLGRSIRNENDHAASYILDSDWERFYRNNSSMFPVEFASTLVK